MRYVLEGSARKNGNRIRVTAQLIDARDGAHLWAERYDRIKLCISDKRQYGEAVAHARRAVKLAPGSADVADLAGFVLAPSRYPEEAAPKTEKAMVLNPNYHEVYPGNLGNAYRLSGRTEQAIAAFKA